MSQDWSRNYDYRVRDFVSRAMCHVCGKDQEVRDAMQFCDCGAIVLSQHGLAYGSSIKIAPKCDYCDDIGVVIIPVSGDMLYTAALRCVCSAGEEVSADVPQINKRLLTRWEQQGIDSFMSRRKAIHDAIERVRQQKNGV